MADLKLNSGAGGEINHEEELFEKKSEAGRRWARAILRFTFKAGV